MVFLLPHRSRQDAVHSKTGASSHTKTNTIPLLLGKVRWQGVRLEELVQLGAVHKPHQGRVLAQPGGRGGDAERMRRRSNGGQTAAGILNRSHRHPAHTKAEHSQRLDDLPGRAEDPRRVHHQHLAHPAAGFETGRGKPGGCLCQPSRSKPARFRFPQPPPSPHYRSTACFSADPSPSSPPTCAGSTRRTPR
jgi:hypothetical protein